MYKATALLRVHDLLSIDILNWTFPARSAETCTIFSVIRFQFEWVIVCRAQRRKNLSHVRVWTIVRSSHRNHPILWYTYVCLFQVAFVVRSTSRIRVTHRMQQLDVAVRTAGRATRCSALDLERSRIRNWDFPHLCTRPFPRCKKRSQISVLGPSFF